MSSSPQSTEEHSKSDQPRRHSRRTSLGVWLVVVLFLLVSYVLSMGPYIWLLSRNLIPRSYWATIDLFYWPLEPLYANSSLFCDFLDWYVQFWESP